jgi:hypothetical protein
MGIDCDIDLRQDRMKHIIYECALKTNKCVKNILILRVKALKCGFG